MGRKQLYKPELVEEILKGIRKHGTEELGFKGVISHTLFYQWKNDYPEFLESVNDALKQYRERKRIEFSIDIEHTRNLAKNYVQEVLQGRKFNVVRKYNGVGELVEVVEKRIEPSWATLEKFFGRDLDSGESRFELRIVEVFPDDPSEDDGDLSIDEINEDE
jgi:hypothetical protein